MSAARFVVATASVMAGGLLWGGPARAVADTNELTRATSLSRQFIVFAPGGLLPHTIGVYAERTRRQWAAILEVGSAWRDPVIVTVRPRRDGEARTPAVRVGVTKTDLHLKYLVVCLTPPPLDEGELRAGLVQALCGEYANRRQAVSRTEPYEAAPIPAWIYTGLARSIGGRDERLVRLAQRALGSGRPPSALAILTTIEPPADPIERQLLEANAWFLVEALLELPQGRQRLRGFLDLCGETKSAWRAFWNTYGDVFPHEEAVERWWAVQMVARANLVPAQNLDLDASRLAMETILGTAVGVRDPAGGDGVPRVIPIQQFWRYHDEPWFNPHLEGKLAGLAALQAQVNPLYRAVIEDYLAALRWLQQRYLNRSRRALQAADDHAARVRATTAELATYLDRIETTHGRGLPAEGIHQFFEAIENLEADEPHRRSPISDYLDQFDR